MNNVNFSILKGKTLVSVEGCYSGSDAIDFNTTDGQKFRLHHYQDCCESVSVEDVCGEVGDLIGQPLLVAEESVNPTDSPDEHPVSDSSFTWTFYRLATMRGWVVIRWFGTSNGYYSESVSFTQA